jgi:hypothetical protein
MRYTFEVTRMYTSFHFDAAAYETAIIKSCTFAYSFKYLKAEG